MSVNWTTPVSEDRPQDVHWKATGLEAAGRSIRHRPLSSSAQQGIATTKGARPFPKLTEKRTQTSCRKQRARRGKLSGWCRAVPIAQRFPVKLARVRPAAERVPYRQVTIRTRPSQAREIYHPTALRSSMQPLESFVGNSPQSSWMLLSHRTPVQHWRVVS